MLSRKSLSIIKNKKVNVPKWRKDPKSIKKYQFFYYFLPHSQKKTRSKLLSSKFFLSYILLLLIPIFGLNFSSNIFPGVLGYASNISIESLFEETNKIRIENNIQAVKLNKDLSNAAYNKALDMFKNNYWSHISPSGTEPWDFILASDYDYIYAGENLAKNFYNSNDVVKAWFDSPSHKDNLLNTNYQEVGFAVVNGVLNGFKTTLVVQMFGQPRFQGNLEIEQDYVQMAKEISLEQSISNNDQSFNSSNENNLSLENQITKNQSQVKNNQDTQNIQNTQNTQYLSLDNQNLDNSFFANNNNSNKTNFISLNQIIMYFVFMFAGFILGLLVLDIVYSHKNNINKITGHTIAHVIFLILSIASVLLVLNPGVIL